MISITLFFHLLPAAIAGFTVYLLTDSLSKKMINKLPSNTSKIIAITIISLVVIGVISGLIMSIFYFVKGGDDNISLVLNKMSSILNELKNVIPPNIQEHIPKSAIEMKEAIVEYLNEHSTTLGDLGKHSLKQFVHVLMGMIIGAFIAFYSFKPHHEEQPELIKQLKQRISNLADSFQKVVFSQVKISAINTILTSIYLIIILPLFGIELPYTKTLILITFLAGLIPVLGNLISNTVIVTVSLGVSMYAAVAALLFLIIIHKLEYFINAKIIGSQIQATAWELLLSMLIMETVFGVSGIISAPILYAYIKNELKQNNLI